VLSCYKNGQKNQQRNCVGHIATLHLRSPLAFITHAQLLAGGEYNFSNAPEVSTTLGHSVHGHRDLLTHCERLGSNAEIDQRGWSIPLPNPVHEVAFLVFCIEFQEGMGIGPTPLRNNALNDYGFFVVPCVSVMCKCGSDQQRKEN